ncbi:hypothetical protein PIB30_011475 [Stylosanthes scabra]|uniref:Uncharacterized protein n=1 Tax=Stylosanthes scabra TaxID=79078 RepID=A0ABU6R4R1_9FABA|nr:hypothetical protein [Stylosanthes scabra]
MALNRQTDENGKPIVPISADDCYSWVKGEVREMSSLFSDVESVTELGDPSSWVRAGSGVKLQFLPCSEEERVYHRGERSSERRLGDPKQCSRINYVLFRQLYKDFKEMFVKVGCVEEQFPVYLDEFGLEKFPLYWYSEPLQILGMNKVNRESLEVIEFLESHVCMKEALSLTMLFKWEKEREYTVRYLETTTGGLKNYFKNRNERGFSASNVVKTEEGVVVNQPAEKKKVPSMKRKRAEEGGSGKKEDLTFIWSEHFPFSVLAEEYFQSNSDFDLIESVDGVTRAQFMQVYAARLLCLGRYEELRAREEAENARAREEVASVQRAAFLEGKRNSRFKDRCGAIEGEALEKKEAKTSKEDHGYDMMAAGFERALKQAQFLFPDIKFDKLDPVKVVHNGVLVDDDEWTWRVGMIITPTSRIVIT